jgi:hypothetical protein
MPYQAIAAATMDHPTKEHDMAHEARITELGDTRRPGAPSRSAVIFGLALRLTLVGVAVSLTGLVFLLRGGLDPVVALTMTLGGAGLAYATGHYVARWLRDDDRPGDTAAPRATKVAAIKRRALVTD